MELPEDIIELIINLSMRILPSTYMVVSTVSRQWNKMAKSALRIHKKIPIYLQIGGFSMEFNMIRTKRYKFRLTYNDDGDLFNCTYDSSKPFCIFIQKVKLWLDMLFITGHNPIDDLNISRYCRCDLCGNKRKHPRATPIILSAVAGESNKVIITYKHKQNGKLRRGYIHRVGYTFLPAEWSNIRSIDGCFDIFPKSRIDGGIIGNYNYIIGVAIFG